MNDAPALAQAQIGIAVDGATEAARSAADIILTQPGSLGRKQREGWETGKSPGFSWGKHVIFQWGNRFEMGTLRKEKQSMRDVPDETTNFKNGDE